jgi:hypothetical protein
MKSFLKVLALIVLNMLLVACGSAMTPTSLPVESPVPTITEAPTITSIPNKTATATIERTFTPVSNQTATALMETTATQAYGPPTLIPTIDPTLVPELLRDAFSVQKMEGVHGHSMQKITGWEYGFGGGLWQYSCPGFVRLDETHILLYPATGQVNGPEGFWMGVNTVPQPVVIDLESGSTWPPPIKPLEYPERCNNVYWSQKLGLLITTRLENEIPNVTTFKTDGSKIADYLGDLLAISPSKTKILIGEDTLVNLQTNTRIELAWQSYEGDYPLSSDYYWTYPDETRIYHCCSYYADLSHGRSFRFRVTDDLQLTDVKTIEDAYASSNYLPFMNGEWVRDNTFFLVHWSWVDDGDIRYLPMFDPVERVLYDVREKAGISPDLTCPETTVSNTGSYVWLECYDKNYWIDLYTFEATEYPGLLNMDVGWSADDKYVWMQGNNSSDEPGHYYIVSTASRELKELAIKPASFSWADLWWNPAGDALAYLAEDGQKLGLVDAQTMSVQETDLPATFKEFYWSPSGDRIALVAEDGSVWQIDYPALQNPEQLTLPVSVVKDITWSPDGSSLSFVGGSDIYIVDTAN